MCAIAIGDIPYFHTAISSTCKSRWKWGFWGSYECTSEVVRVVLRKLLFVHTFAASNKLIQPIGVVSHIHLIVLATRVQKPAKNLFFRRKSVKRSRAYPLLEEYVQRYQNPWPQLVHHLPIQYFNWQQLFLLLR